MTDVTRDLWSALCQLAPLIFQTHIEDMEIYLAELTSRIQNFMFYLMKGTAQWVNKPKFHMLFHLTESISCFGPASLFATERFEGYNSVLRNALIQSNRQSPSKDIGVTFANFQNLRHLFSGGSFWDPKEEAYWTAAESVSAIFENYPSLQKSMGYDLKCLAATSKIRPTIQDCRVPSNGRVPVPEGLVHHLPGFLWHQVAEISFTRKDSVCVNSWILVSQSKCCDMYS
jgi:hypothetical protein